MELEDLLSCAELQFCANSENKVQVQELDFSRGIRAMNQVVNCKRLLPATLRDSSWHSTFQCMTPPTTVLGSMKRQAEPLTEEEVEVLWEKGLLGDHSPQALLNTMVYMNSVYFTLRSGEEHRELRLNSSQISLIDRDGERLFLQCTEDESKRAERVSNWTQGRETSCQHL